MTKTKQSRRRTTMEDPTMTCSMCEELFDSEQELREHQLTVHAAHVTNRKRSRENEPDADEEETAA
jgi:hypothetical protein